MSGLEDRPKRAQVGLTILDRVGKTGGPAGFSINRKSAASLSAPETYGVLAQLVERLNGIEEVRGSNPLGSTI